MRQMLERRLKDAGLPALFSPHSFRVAVVTDLLKQDVPLEDVQYLAGHSNPKSTQIYDRRRRRVTRNIVERISIRGAGRRKTLCVAAYSRSCWSSREEWTEWGIRQCRCRRPEGNALRVSGGLDERCHGGSRSAPSLDHSKEQLITSFMIPSRESVNP